MLFWQILGVIVLLLAVTYVLFVRKFIEIRSSDFVVALIGVIIGLSIGALISLPLARLSGPFGQWLPIVVNVFSVAVVTTYFYTQRATIIKSFDLFISSIFAAAKREVATPTLRSSDAGGVLIDTSAIIDGRILEIARSGFLSGVLVIPKFVLEELQGVADSPDDLRRSRGRRGLEILRELKKERGVTVQVVDEDFPTETEVDAKIIKLAKKRRARMMTVDYNLNRVAQIQNVDVLNVNELHNALRPVVLPGEALHIKIVQEGKDRDQGVGYLEDGTMVVVEGGYRFIGKEIEVSVTRVFQTVAGKMIFAVPGGKK